MCGESDKLLIVVAVLQLAASCVAFTKGISPALKTYRDPSCCFNTPAPQCARSAEWRMSADPFEKLGKGGKKIGKNVARDIAGQLGLNVVPQGQGEKKKKKPASPEPTITWSREVQDFFWGEDGRDEQSPAVELIDNEEEFPLLHLPGVLDEETLTKVLELVEDGQEEEIEQHELVDGKPRAIRRSLVSQLLPSSPIFGLIRETLPEQLCSSPHHKFEDGSVVRYRHSESDFYAKHHDSFSPDDPPRNPHRAFTLLLYLRSPPGPPTSGGTEFTELTRCAESSASGQDMLGWITEGAEGKGVVVKPAAGSALAWPNFGLDGKPCATSAHRALALGQRGEQRTDKVVVNMWFEGHTATVKGRGSDDKGAKKKKKQAKAAPQPSATKGGSSDRSLFPEFDDSDKGTDGFSDGTSPVKGFG